MKIVLLSVLVIIFLSGCIDQQTPVQNLPVSQQPYQVSPSCSGTFNATVTRVVDGDTLVLRECEKRIRLSLTNTPETDQFGYQEAKDFTARLCVNQLITIDQDSGQPIDKYNRILAVVYCNGKNLNAELLENNLAKILTQYCSRSEFANSSWAKKHGC